MAYGGRVVHRLSGVHHAPFPASASISSTNCREAAMAAGLSCTSLHGSLMELSRHTNPNTYALSDGDNASPRNSRQKLVPAGSGQHTPQRSRPTSACESRVAVGAPGVAVRARAVGGGQSGIRGYCNATVLNKSQSARAPRRDVNAEPDPFPYPPMVPREPRMPSARTGNGRPFPRGLISDAAATIGPAAAVMAGPEDATLEMLEAVGVPTGGDVHVSASRQHRMLRPASAKVSKHKRVADNTEKPSVYEDCEDSDVAGEEEELDTCELEMSLTEDLASGCLSAPAKPMLAAPDQVVPPKPMLEAWHRPAPVAGSRLVSALEHSAVENTAGSERKGAEQASSGGGFWPAATWPSTVASALEYPSQLTMSGTCAGLEPRASTPPRRPRLAA